MLSRKSPWLRRGALSLACLLFAQAAVPPLLATGGGPTQPEFTDFEQASGGYTVNPFTGDFTWNLPVMDIPGAHGGGYSLGLSYHSGVTPEQEASWVGYGWTLNPGAIQRSKQGFPDDSDGDVVKYWNRVPRHWTVSLAGSFGAEAFSGNLPFTGNATLRYNNQTGFAWAQGLGLTFADGIGTLNYNLEDGESRFGLSINVGDAMAKRFSDLDAHSSKDPQQRSALVRSYERYASRMSVNLAGAGEYSLLSRGLDSRPMPSPAYVGQSFKLSPSLMGAPSILQLGPDSRLTGGFSYQQNVGTGGVIGGASDLNTYGYMYTGNAGADDMTDYYVEKNNSHETTDRILGIPFSNPDQWIVSGEGLSGGFRAWQNRAGHYVPNTSTSITTLQTMTVEGEVGANVGGGATVGTGQQTLEVKDWSLKGNTTGYFFNPSTTQEDEPVFFRFNGDLTGQVGFSTTDALLSATLANVGNTPGSRTVAVNAPGGVYQKVNGAGRAPRSSMVAYHTNAEMAELDPVSGLPYKAYTRDAAALGMVKRDGASNPISKGVGEFAITQPDGARYVYGLPVYARNEYTLSYDTKNATVTDNFTAYKDLSDDALLETKVGEERPAPYASSYLLTEITGPDYLDRTGNGPTADDMGGYTRFTYTQAIGTAGTAMKNSGDWYTWRVPYNGLRYERGSLSDPADDRTSAQGGEREVYYLKTVETRTHIAYFVTGSTDITVNGFTIRGSGEQRMDGIEAADNASAANSATARGAQKLEKLERIELFAKNANGLPAERIKTAFFEYDYSLCTGIPDHQNHNPANPGLAQTGRLTLKRVWFEYGDAREALIHPWTFDYNYPTTSYPAPYQAQFGNYGAALTQNPNYNPRNVDAWGQHQHDGSLRHNRFQTWLHQGTPFAAFDPAAWHLKRITLPTKGEVHVQYEQHTYSHVQDRDALAMVSLSPTAPQTASKFYLNTADLGTLTAAEKTEMVKLMQERFVAKGEKVYFKYYYKLLGATADPVTSGSCNGDFITGHAQVESVGQDANGVWLQMVSTLGGLEQLPRQVCKDFVQTQRAGRSVLDGNCDPNDGVDGNGGPADVVMSFAGYLAQLNTGIPGGSGSLLSCLDLSEADSYLRVPLPKPKRGGGVRVKRVLMYDAGMEAGDAVLMGKEYLYEETDDNGITTSYGVATNEPASIREESALTTFMERFRQGFLDRVIAGRDKETTEGPLGESILPGASIGYGKVIVKDIHTGPTSSGFVAHEFFTCRDYPFDMQLSLPEGDGSAAAASAINQERDWLLMPLGALDVSVNNLWLTQGFRFVQNDMHGKPKAVSTYGGDFSKPDQWMLSNRESMEYYEPGEPIPVLDDLYATPNLSYPGREAEVVMERMVVADIYSNLDLEVDGDVGLSPVPIPFLSFFPYVDRSTRILSRHITSHVVRYPAVVKRVTTYADGITTTSSTAALSPYNGTTISSTLPDEFHGLNLPQSPSHDGTQRSLSVEAARFNPEMQGKWINERLVIRSAGADLLTKPVVSSEIRLGLPTTPSSALISQMQKLAPGDLVALHHTSSGALEGIYQVKDFYEVGKAFVLLPTRTYKHSTTAVTTSLNLEVLRSGRTHQLSASVGSLNTYGTPQVPNSSTQALAGVTSATAVEFADVWPYDTTLWGGFPNTLPAGFTNAFETGERGKWRPVNSFSYRTGILPGNGEALTQPGYSGTFGRNYNDAGVFTSFTLFPWDNPATVDTSLWISGGKVMAFAPHGEAIETRNALGVRSCVKVGYSGTLPYLTGSNVPATGVVFESFENTYTRGGVLYLEDGVQIASSGMVDATTAHTGARCGLLTSTVQNLPLRQLTGIAGRKCLIRVWAREDYASNGSTSITVGNAHPFLRVTFDGPSGVANVSLKKVAQTGQWSLYEGTTATASVAAGGALTPTLQFNNGTSGTKIWVDDVLVQPLESEVSLSVFDPVSHRVAASLNSNHFATFYQYNAEGRLLRKSIETEDGRKTIQESYVNIPTQTR